MIRSSRTSRKIMGLAVSCIMLTIALPACQQTASAGLPAEQARSMTDELRVSEAVSRADLIGLTLAENTEPDAANQNFDSNSDPEATLEPVTEQGTTAEPTLLPLPTATPEPTRLPTAAPAPTKAPVKATTAATTATPAEIQKYIPGVPVNWPLSAGQQSRVDQFVMLINQARAEAGLPALNTGSAGLQEMAAIRAAEISVKFGHDRPTTQANSLAWSSLFSVFSIKYRWAAENIAGGPETPEAASQCFMGSALHRANILSPDANTIAIGVYTDQTGKDWWVQDFIKAR